MKKTTKVSILLTAATAILCLCGVFFCSPRSEGTLTSATGKRENPKASFSSQKAKEYLSLSKASYYPKSLEAKLSESGFECFEYFLLEQNTADDNGIAFGVAKNHSTVTAVFRGTEKEEWYSNFNIGSTEEHEGFSKASDFAVEKIEEYLENQRLLKSSTDIVITGHSRGGAVANIVASRLIDSGEYASVLAYTFASPNTTTRENAHSKEYQNIFNIINPEDFICYIPLENWNYKKYGTYLEFPMEDSENFTKTYAQMEKTFADITSYPHAGYPNHHKDVEKFLDAAYTLAPTVNDYYNRQITVHPYSVSLYEYMNKAAALLAGHNPISNGMFLISGSNTPTLNIMTDFIMEGVDIEEVAQNADLSKSAIASAHTWETYEAWLEVLPEEYFTNIINS